MIDTSAIDTSGVRFRVVTDPIEGPPEGDNLVFVRPRLPHETDDVDAIQEAVDAAGEKGGTVVFPLAEYHLSAPVLLKGQTLRGFKRK